jgi:cyanuric acid amidohydrolase
MRLDIHVIAMAHPADMSGLEDRIASGEIAPDTIICILGKTEGNGNVNDFTRGYATLAFKHALGNALGLPPAEIGNRVALIMSGGTEGVMSPHCTVFCRIDDGARGQAGRPRLAAGISFTRDFAPEEIGRAAQIEATALAVRDAMADAGITRAQDVHFVQIKCPLLTAERVHDARKRGHDVATEDTYTSMAYSRGASALGVALALGEIVAPVDDRAVCRDAGLFSARASTSAGIELMRNEIMVLGNSDLWSGDLVIGHDVMDDAIDLAAIQRALRMVGIDPAAPSAHIAGQVVAILAKAEASRSGLVRGQRHIMWDDSDIHATRHARAAVAAVLAACVGKTHVYVSGGAEHQGPDGGGPVAVIARTG